MAAAQAGVHDRRRPGRWLRFAFDRVAPPALFVGVAVAWIGHFEDSGAEWASWLEFLRHSMSMWFVLLMAALFAV
jgi:hypothetical protein